MGGFTNLVHYNAREVNLKNIRNPKYRFRAAVRYVIANQFWLIEMLAGYVRPSEVHLRVQQALLPKTNKKLTLEDRMLLNKLTTERTKDEKHYLYRLFGGLTCFKRYPDAVRYRLAGSLYFKYYSPGRVIVRQGHDAHALYFIISGDVIVTKLIWDDLVKKNQTIPLGIMKPGDMFGEVSLLHDVRRCATCSTVGHCELLVLLKEDFKMNLRATVQHLWDRTERAMSRFSYFENLSARELREGVIVSKMKSFEEDEIIMGDGTELTHFVYFILSGTCEIVESMKVFVTTNNREKVYFLYDRCHIPTTAGEPDLETKYFRAYRNKLKLLSMLSDNISGDNIYSRMFGEEDADGSSHSTMKRSPSECKASANTSSVSQTSLSKNKNTVDFIPENLETVFMQVGTLSTGACFNVGENMRDRFIIAVGHVKCLLLPRIWLEQKDPTNNWPRVRRYLDNNIPSKKELFQIFLTQQKCKKNTKRMIEEVVSRSPKKYRNSRHNCPLSTRMM